MLEFRDLPALIDQNPCDWTFNEHRAMHISGLHIWISNGWPCYRIHEPFKQSLSWSMKWKLYDSFRRAKEHQAILMLTKSVNLKEEPTQ